MSHFTVAVITEENPEETNCIKTALAPFHEFECTGKDDEYVQNIDVLDKEYEEYEKDESHMLKNPNGDLVCKYDNQFYRDPTSEELNEIGVMCGSGNCKGFSYHSQDWNDGLGYRPKIRFVPDGHEEVKVPTSQIKSFVDYLEEDGWKHKPINVEYKISKDYKYGWYTAIDGDVVQVVRRTNPNDHWDWYEIGGRWDGWIVKKDGTRTDSAQKKDIDFEKSYEKLKTEDREYRTHAFLRDGVWREKGKMLFWAVVEDEKDNWIEEFDKLMADVPEDHWITIVDCHV